MTNNVLTKALLKLGLSEFESSVYLALFKTGSFNVSQLSQLLKTNRVRVYAAFEKLEQIGLLQRNGKEFNLEPPSLIMFKLRHEEMEVQRIVQDLSVNLPYFQSDYFQVARQPSIRVYEGKSQFAVLLEKVVEESLPGEEMLWLNEGAEFYDIIDAQYFFKILGPIREKTRSP